MQTRTIYDYTRKELAPEYGYPWARNVLSHLEDNNSNTANAQGRAVLRDIRKVLLVNHNQLAFGPVETLLYMHCLYMTLRTMARRLESVGITRALSDSFTDWLLRKGNVRRVMGMHRVRLTFKENLIATAVDALQLPGAFATMFVSKIVADETGSWIHADMLPNEARLEFAQPLDFAVPHHSDRRTRAPRSLCRHNCTPRTLQNLRRSDLLFAVLDHGTLQRNDGVQAAAASIRLYEEKVAYIKRVAQRPDEPPTGSSDEFEWSLEYLTSHRSNVLSSTLLPHITSHNTALEFEVMRAGIAAVMRDVLITAEAVGECFARCADVATSVEFRSDDRVPEARAVLQSICKDTADVIGTINKRLGSGDIRVASRSLWCIDALLDPYESEFWYAMDVVNTTCILLQSTITRKTINAYEHLNTLMSVARAYCVGHPAVSSAKSAWALVYGRLSHVHGFNLIMHHVDAAWKSSASNRDLYQRSRDVVTHVTTLVTEMFARIEVNEINEILTSDTIQLSGFNPHAVFYSSDYLRSVPWWETYASAWYDIPLDIKRNIQCSVSDVARENKCVVHRELIAIAGISTWIQSMVSLVLPTDVMRTIMMFGAYHRKRASDAMVFHLIKTLVTTEKQPVGLRPLLLRLVVTPSRSVADFPSYNEVSYALKAISADGPVKNALTTKRMEQPLFGPDASHARRVASIDTLVLKCYVIPKGRDGEATPTRAIVLDVECSANTPVSVTFVCEAYEKSANNVVQSYPLYGESTMTCVLIPAFDGRLIVSY